MTLKKNKSALVKVGVCSVAAVVAYLTNHNEDLNKTHPLQYSERAMVLLTGKWEGCHVDKYPDTGGLQTVGVGHLCTGSEPNRRLTIPEVAELLHKDLYIAEQCVMRYFNGAKLPVAKREALTDFVFNVGCGKATANKTGSKTKIRRLALTGQYDAICHEFLNWSKGRNLKGELVTIKGLLNRRQAEKEWCLK